MFRIAIITVSDKGAAGQREDLSGPLIAEMVSAQGWQTVLRRILPDEREQVADALRQICDSGAADLVFTTGGTGFSPRIFRHSS